MSLRFTFRKFISSLIYRLYTETRPDGAEMLNHTYYYHYYKVDGLTSVTIYSIIIG